MYIYIYIYIYILFLVYKKYIVHASTVCLYTNSNIYIRIDTHKCTDMYNASPFTSLLCMRVHTYTHGTHAHERAPPYIHIP